MASARAVSARIPAEPMRRKRATIDEHDAPVRRVRSSNMRPAVRPARDDTSPVTEPAELLPHERDPFGRRRLARSERRVELVVAGLFAVVAVAMLTQAGGWGEPLSGGAPAGAYGGGADADPGGRMGRAAVGGAADGDVRGRHPRELRDRAGPGEPDAARARPDAVPAAARGGARTGGRRIAAGGAAGDRAAPRAPGA